MSEYVQPRLAAASLMADAVGQTGFEDYGDLDFVGRVDRWFEAIAEEAEVSAMGVALLTQVVTGWLVNRLRMHADIEAHPEILEIDIPRPIFVTGMPRTGTTKLQRMLASDVQFQGIPFWLVLNPAPIPGTPSGPDDPRRAIGAGFLDAMSAQAADFLTAHPAFVDEPEEESFIMETDFRSLANCTRVRVPSYWTEIATDPERESYGFLHRHLQYIAWQRGDGQRPFVLKSPLHVGRVERLLEEFPDATIVHTHRDPLAALPSTARITEVFRGMTTDSIDLAALGSEMLETWSELFASYLVARERLGSDHFIDASYEQICSKPFEVINEIHQRRGTQVSSEALAAMTAWEAANPQHQFGRHAYSLERYELQAEDIDKAFAAYVNRFAIELGRK